MTFKEFAWGAFVSPATVLGGISKLLFGDYARNKDGSLYQEATDEQEGKVKAPKDFPGLLGFIANGIGGVGKAITHFIKINKPTIASAFWASLLIGGGVALTVALWPAALALATGLSIYGISIAALVGTGFAAQVTATAGLAFAATSALTYAVASVVGVVKGIVNFFTPAKPKAPGSEGGSANENEYDSSNPLTKLGGNAKSNENRDILDEDVKTAPIFQVNHVKTQEDKFDLEPTNVSTATI